MFMLAPTKNLSDKLNIPVLGFGTWQITGQEAYDSVTYALDHGYRHIDTADHYGNHLEIGKAIEKFGLDRDEIHLTTKIWRSDLAYDDVLKNTERFLNELRVEYIDLLLVHWPNDDIPIDETLLAFKELEEQDKILGTGVSNFTQSRLQNTFDSLVKLEKDIEIVNNQVELHPSLYQKELVQFCFDNDISITAYSPIAQGKDLQIEEIQNLAVKYNATESQVILAWMRQRGIIAVPRSSSKNHIEENFDSLKFKLENDDLQILDELDRGNRLINPGYANFE
jgi:diketogulonate reductase-like aldo/keto reductase